MSEVVVLWRSTWGCCASCTSELQLKMNCREKFGLACKLLAQKAQIFPLELGKVNVRSRMVLSKCLRLVVELSRAHPVCKIKFGINKLPLVFFCDVAFNSEIAIIFQFLQKKKIQKNSRKFRNFFFENFFRPKKFFTLFWAQTYPGWHTYNN